MYRERVTSHVASAVVYSVKKKKKKNHHRIYGYKENKKGKKKGILFDC